MNPPLLQLEQIACHYDHEPVVRDISFSLEAGQIACLLGPSGCGKTTTLRTIAGLEPLTAGRILIDGQEASRPGFTLAPEKRGLGMVFQEHALFPHLNVSDNVAFALRKLSPSAREQRVRECLAMVRLDELGERFPHELSGGQQQRVALARALAPRPRLMLLDEPFASLDLDLRRQLNRELLGILKLEGITAVMVTHDQEEAFAMASHIAILRAGELVCIEGAEAFVGRLAAALEAISPEPRKEQADNVTLILTGLFRLKKPADLKISLGFQQP